MLIPTSTQLKKALSWVVSGLGVCLGLFALVLLGCFPLDSHYSWSQWIFLLTTGPYGLVCLFGSFIALRDRRKAALCFLWAIPAWVLVLMWGLFQALVVMDGFVFLPLMSIAFVLPAGFGIFWFVTGKFGWPSILPIQSRPLRQRILRTSTAAIVIFGIVSVAATLLSVNRLFFFDCRETPPFARQQSPDQIAFVAETLYAACSHGQAYDVCRWAQGHVQEHFWGLRWWQRSLVVLTGNFKAGEQYFVEGMHLPGLWTRFFPVVVFVPCGHSSLLKDSIEFRILHDGPPKNSVRIIGRVESFASDSPVANADVVISGPSGTVKTRSDAVGIYDVSGLPPGRYRVGIADPNPTSSSCGESVDMKSGDVWGCTLSTLKTR